MYATISVSGILAIERDGEMVLSVCGQDWEFAEWLCALLNEIGRKPLRLLTQRDVEWLKVMDDAFGRREHYA